NGVAGSRSREWLRPLTFRVIAMSSVYHKWACLKASTYGIRNTYETKDGGKTWSCIGIGGFVLHPSSQKINLTKIVFPATLIQFSSCRRRGFHEKNRRILLSLRFIFPIIRPTPCRCR